MKTLHIMSLGEVLWDLFPDRECFGGAPANFACHTAILGGDVAIVSAVGDDRRGRDAIRILRGFGVDVRLLQVTPDAPTGTVGVALDHDGRPTFRIHEGSAWDRMTWNEELCTKVMAADAICFGTLGQRSEISRGTIRRCVEMARSAGIPRLLDINLRPPFYDNAMIRESIQLASILKLSDEELGQVCAACGIHPQSQPDRILQELIATQKLDLVVMTRGAHGAVLAAADGIIEQPGIPTVVRDTVGAGDSFAAAFLLGWLRGESPQQNLLAACSIAAAVCSHSGAVPDQTAGDMKPVSR